MKQRTQREIDRKLTIELILINILKLFIYLVVPHTVFAIITNNILCMTNIYYAHTHFLWKPSRNSCITVIVLNFEKKMTKKEEEKHDTMNVNFVLFSWNFSNMP